MVDLRLSGIGMTSARTRDRLIATLREQGIANEAVLARMRDVPRHLFVPPEQRDDAYGDFPLPIGHGQTISQPYIVAFMTEALDVGPTDRVLEIGTGSGYQAAVLSLLAKDVYTIEIVEPLAARARTTLSELGYRNVHVRTGNGYLGWPEQAPFDRIIVTAAAPHEPKKLLSQLKPNGVLVAPVGRGSVQNLKRYAGDGQGDFKVEVLCEVRFVPLLDGVAREP